MKPPEPLPPCQNCFTMGLLTALWLFGLLFYASVAQPDDYFTRLFVWLCYASILSLPIRHAWLHYELKPCFCPGERAFDLAAGDALDRAEAVITDLKNKREACALFRSDDGTQPESAFIECLIVFGLPALSRLPRQIFKLTVTAGRLSESRCTLSIRYQARVPIFYNYSIDRLNSITNCILLTLKGSRSLLFLDAPINARPSDSYQRRVEALSDRLPRQVKLVLLRHGCKIAAVRRLTDLFPKLTAEMPSGYGRDSTYEHCAALYSPEKRLIALAEQYKKGDDWLDTDEGYTAQSIEHETGHAIDHAMGVSGRYFSHSDEFDKAYLKDRGKLDPEAASRLGYYLQEGFNGKEETFADIFNSVSLSWHDADYIEEVFPRTTELIKNRLSEVKLELAPNRRFNEAEVRTLIPPAD